MLEDWKCLTLNIVLYVCILMSVHLNLPSRWVLGYSGHLVDRCHTALELADAVEFLSGGQVGGHACRVNPTQFGGVSCSLLARPCLIS